MSRIAWSPQNCQRARPKSEIRQIIELICHWMNAKNLEAKEKGARILLIPCDICTWMANKLEKVEATVNHVYAIMPTSKGTPGQLNWWCEYNVRMNRYVQKFLIFFGDYLRPPLVFFLLLYFAIVTCNKLTLIKSCLLINENTYLETGTQNSV